MLKLLAIIISSALGLAIGFGIYLTTAFGNFVLPLQNEFGWSRVEITAALTFATWPVILVSPVLGRLVDRIGPRRVVLASLPLMSGLFALLAVLPGHLPTFYALHLLLPVVAAGTFPVVFTRSVVGWFNQARGLALGFSLAGVGLGATLLPVILQATIAQGGWRAGYWMLSLSLLLIVLPAVLVGFRDPPSPTAPSVSRGRAFRHILTEVVRKPVFWQLAVAFFALGVVTLGLSVSLISVLAERAIVGAAAAGLAATLGTGLIVGRVAAGFLIDRLPPPRVAIASLAICSSGIALLGAAGGDQLVIVVALVATGLGFGAEIDFMSYFVSRKFALVDYGTVFGIIYAIFQFGCGVGPLITSWLHAATGTYFASLNLLAALGFAAAGAFALIGRAPTIHELAPA